MPPSCSTVDKNGCRPVEDTGYSTKATDCGSAGHSNARKQYRPGLHDYRVVITVVTRGHWKRVKLRSSPQRSVTLDYCVDLVNLVRLLQGVSKKWAKDFRIAVGCQCSGWVVQTIWGTTI